MFNINRIIREEIQKYIDFFGGKKIKAVIFDFDFTLVDSTAFAEVKKYAIANRDFSVMFEKIPEVKPFNGIKELVNFKT
jgi:FMN phosphatase YigB (HAD superfamily)